MAIFGMEQKKKNTNTFSFSKGCTFYSFLMNLNLNCRS